MSLSAVEIIQVMERAKELGFSAIKVEGIELGSQVTQVVAPPVVVTRQEVPELNPEQIVQPLSVLDDLDDDEVMYWSTPYGLELQAKKEAQRQAVKDQE